MNGEHGQSALTIMGNSDKQGTSRMGTPRLEGLVFIRLGKAITTIAAIA